MRSRLGAKLVLQTLNACVHSCWRQVNPETPPNLTSPRGRVWFPHYLQRQHSLSLWFPTLFHSLVARPFTEILIFVPSIVPCLPITSKWWRVLFLWFRVHGRVESKSLQELTIPLPFVKAEFPKRCCWVSHRRGKRANLPQNQWGKDGERTEVCEKCVLLCGLPTEALRKSSWSGTTLSHVWGVNW
jgi:hypothetical protein